jgi:hypothetical protein
MQSPGHYANKSTTIIASNGVTPLTLTPRGGRHEDTSYNFWSGSLVIVTMVVLLVAIIVLASFWASDDEERLKRQRTYARVDDLYFPLHGIVLTRDNLNDIRQKSIQGVSLDQYLDTFITSEFRITSLSLGGCAIKTERALAKGELVLLKLSELPDYPAPDHAVVYKVAWVRDPKHPDHDPRYSAGLQAIETLSRHPSDPLKKYMSYLLDEPAA